MLPVYKNLFTNPRLVGDGTWAEVRRNHGINPGARGTNTLDHSHWAGGGTATATWVDASWSSSGKARRFVLTTVGAQTPTGQVLALNDPLRGLTAGTWTIVQHQKLSPGLTAVAADFGEPGSGNTLAAQGTVALADGVLRRWATVSLALVGSGWTGNPRINFNYSGASVGASVELSMVDIYPGAYDPNRMWSDGATLPANLVQPEDFRVRWVGAANASESVLEIERVAGLTATNCIAGVSTWEGEPAVRQIPTVASNNSYAALSVPSGPARSSGTLLGTSRLLAPLTGSTFLAGALRVITPDQALSAIPNIAGSYPQRLEYAALTSNYQVRLMHGGSVGSGDVWWTDIGLFAGEYDGPAFSGDSGVIIIDGQPYDTFWAGMPGSSPSLAILSEGGYSGSIYDTLYVFSTVSNSWVRWQTPAVRGQRPVTLARVTSAPSAEAYTMRVSRRIFDEVRDLYTTPY